MKQVSHQVQIKHKIMGKCQEQMKSMTSDQVTRKLNKKFKSITAVMVKNETSSHEVKNKY